MQASKNQLHNIFGVSVIDGVVKISASKLYGFASCHNHRKSWIYTVGGFLKLQGLFHGEMGFWESLDEEEQEEDNLVYYNCVFFEIDQDELVPIGIIMKASMDKKMEYLSDGFETKHKKIMADLTRVMMDTYEEFDWQV